MENLLQNSILIGILVALWSNIKAFIWRFAQLFIVRVQDAKLPSQKFYWDHLKSHKFLSPVFISDILGSGSDSRMLYKIVGGTEYKRIKVGNKWALAKLSNEMLVTIYSFKFYLSYEEIYCQMAAHYSSFKTSQETKKQQRFYTKNIRGSLNKSFNFNQKDEPLFDPGGVPKVATTDGVLRQTESYDIGLRMNYTKEDYLLLTSFHNEDKSMMDYLYLSDEMKEIENKIQIWFKNKKWFLERGIQWKRGFLLHGIPGTGKTSFITALAEKFKVPLYVFDLATFTNEDLEKEWNTLKHSTPCFVLFEDFDAIFKGREHLEAASNMASKPVSFDCVLNILDGAVKYDGIVTFITTNKMDHIDEALGGNDCSRPGRIDHICKMEGITDKAKHFIAKSIIYGFDGEEELREKISRESKSVTQAQFKDECINAALNEYQKTEEENLSKKTEKIRVLE